MKQFYNLVSILLFPLVRVYNHCHNEYMAIQERERHEILCQEIRQSMVNYCEYYV